MVLAYSKIKVTLIINLYIYAYLYIYSAYIFYSKVIFKVKLFRLKSSFTMDSVVKFKTRFQDLININKEWANVKISFIVKKISFLIKQ